MATKDRRKLQHIHSSIADKQPTPQSLEVGEIAVNNSANKEFLSLKNSNDKVVRFSSDSTIIDWIENKEVVPYKGYVRGETGPSATSGDSPTADAYGSYGITNNDLLTNKSNIIVKINQVAAKNTVKYNKINAAKDRYNKDINPSENTPTGKTDGAGFFIDMSRYAMQGANPTFSGITNTCYTNLNGTTKIKGINGACGSLLDITVNSAKTDIETADTEITSATTVIGTNSTTISGNTTLNVSGTTIETKKDVVIENNLSAKTENTTGVLTENNRSNHILNTTGKTNITRTDVVTEDNKNNVVRTTSGTTTETFKDQVTENNQSGYTVNTTGNVVTNTTGTTTETKVGNVIETNLANKKESTSGNSYNDVKLAYSGTTGGTTTEVKVGVVTENNLSAKTENTTGVLTENNSSNHIVNTTGATNITRTGVVTEDNKNNVTRTTSGNTTETFKGQVTENNQSGYTINTTGNVIVNTTGTTTETKNGNVTENHSGTTTENYAGKWTVNVTSGTEITSCSSTTINTNKFKVTQCDGDAGTAEFDFCAGYKINTDKMEILQCSANGTMDVKEKAITVSGTSLGLSGTSLTVREGGATDFSGNTLTATTAGNANINVKGNLTEAVTGTTNETHTGAVTINNGSAKTETTTGAVIENNKAGYTVNTTGDTCLQSTADVNIGGAASTNIGTNCDDSVKANYVNIKAKSGITETANTVTISGTTSANISGATVNVSGGTINETSSGKTCIQAGTDLNIGGDATTNVGTNCAGGVYSNNVNIYAQTAITETAATVNISGTSAVNVSGGSVSISGGTIKETSTGNTCITANADLNVGGNGNTRLGYNCDGTGIADNTYVYASTAVTVNAPNTYITGNTNISGVTTIGDTLVIKKGLEKTLSWTYGDVKGKSSGSTNFSGDTSFVIPQKVGDLSGGTLTFTHNGYTGTYNATSNVTFSTPHSALTWQYGSVTGASNGSYDTSVDKTVTIPKNLKHLTNDLNSLTAQYGGNVANRTTAATYNGSSAVTIDIPTSLSGLTNGVVVDTNTASKTDGCISFTKPLCVTGTITASGAIYSSDRNLKENIMNVTIEEINMANNVLAKSFNFKSDESKSKVYGVIAQDVQEAGLGELVHTDENGNLGVDYTSLLLLKIAYLEDLCGKMYGRIKKLEEKI